MGLRAEALPFVPPTIDDYLISSFRQLRDRAHFSKQGQKELIESFRQEVLTEIAKASACWGLRSSPESRTTIMGLLMTAQVLIIQAQGNQASEIQMGYLSEMCKSFWGNGVASLVFRMRIRPELEKLPPLVQLRVL